MPSRSTLPADQRREAVAAWRESVLIDACGPAEPDRHPAFAGAGVYRGSAGAWSSGGVELTRPRHRRPVECRAFGRAGARSSGSAPAYRATLGAAGTTVWNEHAGRESVLFRDSGHRPVRVVTVE